MYIYICIYILANKSLSAPLIEFNIFLFSPKNNIYICIQANKSHVDSCSPIYI